jgi:DNA-binding transcriptional MerR regulator
MAHEIAKLLLENTATFLERAEAVKTALSLGMPLNEIEEYLDWLEATGSRPLKDEPGDGEPPAARPPR